MTVPLACVADGEVVGADSLDRVVRELERGDAPQVIAAAREPVAEARRRPAEDDRDGGRQRNNED